MNQIKEYDVCDKQFIDDQRLFRLELTGAERKITLHFLKLEHLPQSGLDVPKSELEREKAIDRDFRSRWREIKKSPRYRVLAELPTSRSGRPRRQLLCVTASGGIGKSIALAQLVAIRPQMQPGHLVFSFHISELPDGWDQYLKNVRTSVTVEAKEREKKREKTTQLEPLLIDGLLKRFVKLGETRAGSLPNDSEKESQKLRDWIIAEIRQGTVTLVVDGLDELPVSDGHAKVQALRLLLSHYDRLHCVVGVVDDRHVQEAKRQRFLVSSRIDHGQARRTARTWLARLSHPCEIRWASHSD